MPVTYSVFFRPTDTGLTPTFVKFCNRTTGASLLPGPAITAVDVGGVPGTNTGEYKFTYTPGVDVSFTIDGGASLPAELRYIRGVSTPDDTFLDQTISALNTPIAAVKADTQRIKAEKEGRWKIFTSGGDANRLVLYDTDGVTPLQKWDLKDIAGAPTTTAIYERVPVLPIP